MPVQLPLDSLDPKYRVGITLNDVPYILDVRWNDRDGAWYFDMLDIDDDPIRMGIKIVLGTALGWRSTDPRFPNGGIFAEDLSGEGRDATIDDLGTRVMVYYYTVAELSDPEGLP
jgi:hypothetical protein